MYIKVRVITNSKKEIWKMIKEDTYQIEVREEASMGKANARVKAILSEIFSTQNIRLVSGHTNYSKIFNVQT